MPIVDLSARRARRKALKPKPPPKPKKKPGLTAGSSEWIIAKRKAKSRAENALVKKPAPAAAGYSAFSASRGLCPHGGSD